MSSKKRKKRGKFTIVIVPESAKEVKQMQISGNVAITICTIILILEFIAIAYISYGINSMGRNSQGEKELADHLAQLTEENNVLQKEKEALQQQIDEAKKEEGTKEDQSQEIEKEEQEQLPVTLILPVDGTASIESEFQGNEEGQQRGITFRIEGGTAIVAAGGGTVTFADVSQSGEGNEVRIDHGSNYVSIYRSSGAVKVYVGEVVEAKAELFERMEEGTTLNYEVTYEEVFIDPISVMEVYG